MDIRVRHALRLMSEDLRGPLALEEVARTVNLSETRLRSLFRAETGTTPARHLKSLRIRKAKELLEGTFLNVKQIMFEVGIAGRTHFARDFRELYGECARVRSGSGAGVWLQAGSQRSSRRHAVTRPL